MFRIINIIIPNTKESTRLKNKNRMLRDYTLQWLAKEIPTIESQEQIAIVWELRNKNVPVNTENDKQYSFKIYPLFVPDEYSNDMKPLLKWCEKRIKGDVNVLLQLTQPLRREGLLSDTITTLDNNPKLLVASYAEVPGERWRIIHDNRWLEEYRNTNESDTIKLYDGSIYAWDTDYKCAACLWNFKQKKSFVKNTEYLVDIDYQKDYDNFMKLKEMNK